MAPRLLMIHESPVPAALREVACADACCEGADAAAFNPDSLAQCAADLVIVIAIPPAPRALGLFRWLKTHAIATPTLAVLPEEPDHHLMEAAAEGVDDFVLCPVRKSEWRQRIIRRY